MSPCCVLSYCLGSCECLLVLEVNSGQYDRCNFGDKLLGHRGGSCVSYVVV